MPKKKDPTAEDTADVRDELTEPNPVPELKDDVVTLKLKQNAYWAGVWRPQGWTQDFPRAEALELLRTTGLFEVK